MDPGFIQVDYFSNNNENIGSSCALFYHWFPPGARGFMAIIYGTLKVIRLLLLKFNAPASLMSDVIA